MTTLRPSDNKLHPVTHAQPFRSRSRFLVVMTLVLAFLPLSSAYPQITAQEMDSQGAAASTRGNDRDLAAAYAFLFRQMDRFAHALPVSGSPEYQPYSPSGKMGMVADLSLQTVQCAPPRFGRGCLKIDYHPPESPSPDHWAGFYFQYPENNWGQFPGRALTGSTTVSFWAKSEPPMAVTFLSGGINHLRRDGPYGDTFQKTLPVMLDQEWRSYSISLLNEDLSSVIGPFGMVVAIGQGGRPGSIFLDEVKIDVLHHDEPRFLQSFVPGGCITGAPENVCHVYDQALVMLAFLARGTPEDIRRAELIAQAFVQAQNNDRTFKDGRLRNAYASGPLLDSFTGKARLPGQWDSKWGDGKGKYIEDEYSAGSDTGNAAWAGLALVQAHCILPQRQGGHYLNAARKLAGWIVKENRVETSPGGSRGGYVSFEPSASSQNKQLRSEWRSTEHNIDLVALFGHLADAVGRNTVEGRKWLSEQAHARNFVENMINAQGEGHLSTGTEPGSDKRSQGVIPLDPQTWSVLGMGQPELYRPAVEWALRHCRAGTDYPQAFDFNCHDGDGAWWEGTAQMAVALTMLGREDEAKPLLSLLRQAQITDGPAAGALPAASKCGLSTGFYHFWPSENKEKPWCYPNTPHIGATAWYLFALLGKNPFFLDTKERR